MSTASVESFECHLCFDGPFATDTELSQHVSGSHAGAQPAPEPPRRFETVSNGFGGTTTRRRDEGNGRRRSGVRFASARQAKYAMDLAAERKGIAEAEPFRTKLNKAFNDNGCQRYATDEVEPELVGTPKVPWQAAREAIDGLKDIRVAKPERAPRAELEDDGIYLLDGRIFKVVRGRNGQYAKRLDESTNRHGKPCGVFTFVPRAISSLRPEHRITLERAAEFGHRFNFCGYCGAYLENPISVRRGVGPICWANNGGGDDGLDESHAPVAPSLVPGSEITASQLGELLKELS